LHFYNQYPDSLTAQRHKGAMVQWRSGTTAQQFRVNNKISWNDIPLTPNIAYRLVSRSFSEGWSIIHNK
jgi:hypothetical protein